MADLYSNPSHLIPGLGNSGQTTNPWFTVANQFVPRNLHDVIRWARYITLQSPTTSEVIRKLSTYPITDFDIKTNKETLKEKYKDLYKSFKLKEFLQNVGFEFFTVGNSFISIYFPIHRSLTCPSCKTVHSAKSAHFLSFKQYQFTGECPVCSYKGSFIRKDTKSLEVEDMNVIRWSPEHMVVDHNPITGESEYYYRIPNTVKRKIQEGNKLFVNSVPWGFIEAVRYNQDFKFDKANIFHLKNVSTGGSVEGISVPPLLSLFSLVFYQATLRKANEAIATEYLNPLRVIFPQAQTANSDPATSMNLRNFSKNMEDALKKHKQDKNHILVAPVPVGYSPIGGEGRNLLVSQEIQQAEDSILLSLGVSRELLSGTTNWTSSAVGLRMMENLLLGYVSRLQDLIDWITSKVTSYLSLELVEATMIPFKLYDDDMLKQLMVNLNGTTKISDTTLLSELGLDFSRELDLMKNEQVDKAKVEVELQYETEQAQILAAQGKGAEMSNNEEAKSILQKSQELAEQLYNADEGSRRSLLAQLKTQDYTQWLLVSKLLEEAKNSQDHQAMIQEGAQQIARDQAGKGNLGSGQDNQQTQQNQGN